jgi:type I restriction enzyme M protein
LLKVADEAKTKVTIYGQEKDAATSGLARMNMILHDNAEAQIVQGNTLTDPKFLDNGALRSFDYVVANPPFSDKRWSTGLDSGNDPFDRFEGFGVPPNKQGDYAYLLHIVRSLKSTGAGACILPHGVLFRGNAEAAIRKNLIRRGYIKGIIGLPANLFYGTGIPACIVVLDKQDAQARKGIFMIDASAGFIKEGPKNRLRAQDIHKIVDVFGRQAAVPKYSRMVSFEEIEKNDFNLNLPRYIDSQPPEDRQDIAGHLKGGIPAADVEALQAYWNVCPDLRSALFKPNRAGYLDLAVDKAAIKPVIYQHPQFAAFIARMAAHFDTWRAQSAQRLKALVPGCRPQDVIATLSEALLAHYRDQPLIDAYAVYQHAMDYWAASMQDDVHAIAADGWKAQTQRVIEQDKKGREKDKGWACDLVPKALVVARYFAAEQAALDQLAADLDITEAQLTELEEEHGGEDAAFSGFDKINAKAVEERLDEIADLSSSSSRRKPGPSDFDGNGDEETPILQRWLDLDKQRAALKKQIKQADAALDQLAYEKYPQLSETEIKALVVDDKWLAALQAAIHNEMERISQALTRRVKELADRYAAPLPQLETQVAALQAKVDAHLQRMGFAWA